LIEENTALKAENADLKEKLETEATIFRLVGETYNEYARIKHKYIGMKIEKQEHENEIVNGLAPFLHAVLDLCRRFRAGSQCVKERNILRDFAEEQRKIFGEAG